jgi:hypothetical protein
LKGVVQLKTTRESMRLLTKEFTKGRTYVKRIGRRGTSKMKTIMAGARIWTQCTVKEKVLEAE